jgi:hypothetical protein
VVIISKVPHHNKVGTTNHNNQCTFNNHHHKRAGVDVVLLSVDAVPHLSVVVALRNVLMLLVRSRTLMLNHNIILVVVLLDQLIKINFFSYVV